MDEITDGGNSWIIRKPLFVWNAAALIEAAIAHKGTQLSRPIDRKFTYI